MKQKRRGFTLIELLVVIAIIGILASIVTVNLSSARTKAKDAKRMADIKSIQLGLALYYNDNLRYPCDIYAVALSSSCPDFAGVYMGVVPTDPNPSSNGDTGKYFYAASTPTGAPSCGAAGGPTRYHLGALLEATTATGDVDAGNTPTACLLSPSNFLGLSTDCAGAVASSDNDRCYDVNHL